MIGCIGGGPGTVMWARSWTRRRAGTRCTPSCPRRSTPCWPSPSSGVRSIAATAVGGVPASLRWPTAGARNDTGNSRIGATTAGTRDTTTTSQPVTANTATAALLLLAARLTYPVPATVRPRCNIELADRRAPAFRVDVSQRTVCPRSGRPFSRSPGPTGRGRATSHEVIADSATGGFVLSVEDEAPREIHEGHLDSTGDELGIRRARRDRTPSCSRAASSSTSTPRVRPRQPAGDLRPPSHVQLGENV